MNDDDIARALAAVAREQGKPPSDPRWAELSGASLSPEDVAALRALAQASPEGEDAWQAYAPFDDAERARFATAALASLATAPGASAFDDRDALPEHVAAAPIADDPDALVTRTPKAEGFERPRQRDVPRLGVIAAERGESRGAERPPAAAIAGLGRRARVVALVLPLVAAAAGFFVFVRAPRGATLPDYEMTVRGGERTTRSTDDVPAGAPVVLGAGSQVDVVLRPETSVDGEIVLRTFVLRDGSASVVDAPSERSAVGAFHLGGSRERVFPGVGPGSVEVVFVVGRPGDVPLDGATLVRALAAPPPTVRVFRRAFTFGGP